MKALRDNGGVVFVMDQYMSPPMGEPMRLFESMSIPWPRSRRSRAVRERRSCPCFPNATTDRVRIIIEPAIGLTADDKADNQRLATHVEGWMRAVPGQVLWAHRRFKDVDWSDRLAHPASRSSLTHGVPAGGILDLRGESC